MKDSAASVLKMKINSLQGRCLAGMCTAEGM